jgi:hypothetical protein
MELNEMFNSDGSTYSLLAGRINTLQNIRSNLKANLFGHTVTQCIVGCKFYRQRRKKHL